MALSRPMEERKPLWRIKGSYPEEEKCLQKALGLHPIVARLLVQRGIRTPEEAQRFLYPRLDHLCDPSLLPDVEAACERLKRAIVSKESILVHGDYDSDGVTSAALWTRLLRRLGANVEVFVPHRKRDGYDMRQSIVDWAKQKEISLILTTDCGVRRVEEVEYARTLGIDVIITDHHLPPEQLPRAVAVVNPHRSDSRYPFPHLAGVGVAFRCGEALVRYLGLSVESYRRAYLDLVAIGTITDVMPLLGENRVLVTFGLRQLQETKKPGLRALMEVSGLWHTSQGPAPPSALSEPLSAQDIAFGLGPRLNAASRVGETQPALDLLLTTDLTEARRLAQYLNSCNKARQEEQKRIFQEALQHIQSTTLHKQACIVVEGSGWGSGIIGLVAAKITECYHRPSIVLSIDHEKGEGRASARSIAAFNLGEALELCRPLLIDGGGHAHAAGFSIRLENVAELKKLMEAIARKQLTEEDLLPVLEADAELSPSHIDEVLVEQLERLAPFGMENPEPLFVTHGAQMLSAHMVGRDLDHLKLYIDRAAPHGLEASLATEDDACVVEIYVTDSPTKPNPPLEALMWGKGSLVEELVPGPIDICYRLQRKVFQGEQKIQLFLEDIRLLKNDEKNRS